MQQTLRRCLVVTVALLTACGGLAACGSTKKATPATATPTPGVTPTTITVGNVSSISGPIPGIFQGAQYGAEAYFAYINSMGGVGGRMLKLQTGDDGFNCSQNGNETTSILPQVLAFVGSFSTSDTCSAPIFAKNPNVADVSFVIDPPNEALANNFSVSPDPVGWRTGPLNYYKTKFPGHTTVGTLYAAGSVTSWDGMAGAMKSVGYKIAYQRGYQPTETDFTADVLRMKNDGVNFVALTATDPNTIARVINTIQQQNWNPLIDFGGSIYAVNYLKLIHPGALNNAVQDQAFSMFLGEDAKTTPEVGLFDTWMTKTHPNFAIDLYAMYSWAEARLFVQALKSEGPNPTRDGLIAALSKIHNFSSNGLVAAADPAGKVPAHCWIAIVVRQDKYQRLNPASGYNCTGIFYQPPKAS